MAKKTKTTTKDESGEKTVYAVTTLSAENIFATREEAEAAAVTRSAGTPGVEVHVLESLNSFTSELEDEETDEQKSARENASSDEKGSDEKGSDEKEQTA